MPAMSTKRLFFLFRHEHTPPSPYPNNNALGRVGDDRVGGIAAVSLQAHDEIEESLIRVGLALFAHVVGRRLVKVEPSHRDLGDLILLQLEPGRMKKISKATE